MTVSQGENIQLALFAIFLLSGIVCVFFIAKDRLAKK